MRFSCARDSVERGESLAATASTVRRWLVIEQPGPWGRDALTESRIGGELGTAIHAAAGRVKARVILVRRHGREDVDARGHTLHVAWSGSDGPWLERFELDDPADVLDLDLGPLRRGGRVGGHPVDEPLYLVCTNGAHDACCAEYGRPVAAALSAARPAATWECSHIGGDRFAANVVCLPYGLYHGRVPPEDAARIAERYEAGAIHLPSFRGRSAYPFHVQAADILVRERLGIDGIDELRLRSPSTLEDGSARVTFERSDGSVHRAVLDVRPDPVGQLLTCRAEGRACPPRYTLVELDSS
jgi:hypothetical protein